MEKLVEIENQQIREKVFQPVAKFIGTLLFETEEKFNQKMKAFIEKLASNFGWEITHRCSQDLHAVTVWLCVETKVDGRFLSTEIVVQPRGEK